MPETKRKYVKKDLNYWNSLSSKGSQGSQVAQGKFNNANLGDNEEDQGPFLILSSNDQAKDKLRLNTSMGSLAVKEGDSGRTKSRRNAAGQNTDHSSLDNIRKLSLPYSINRRGDREFFSIHEAVYLCQLAYANIAVYRNVVEIMTEFSSAKLHLSGGNSRSKSFIKKWFKKININTLVEQFFREYYRSGNVFIYQFEGKLDHNEIRKLSDSKSLASLDGINIPIKYTILNPCEIIMEAASMHSKNMYTKILSDYQLEKIKKAKTEEDRQILKSLPNDVRKKIEKGSWHKDGITITLDPQKLNTVFYKKQDYEPFAIPFGYPVLEDLDYKLELKKIDRAISRVIQQSVLLITMGEQNKDGEQVINRTAMKKMQDLMSNETVGRTVVSDYTTEMKFIIPAVGQILDPKKYQIVNEDIREGLINLMSATGEKFANQSIKIKVFLERLIEGRRVFIDSFLQPEINRICKAMGFQSYPEVFFEEVDLKDEVQFHRIWLRLLELGILTPEQTFEAMKSGVLPESDELKQSQDEYIKDRKKGHYTPVMSGNTFYQNKDEDKKSGGPDPNNSKNGRPPGSTGVPQSTKNVSPMGQSVASNQDIHSLKNIKSTFYEVCNFISSSESLLKEKYNLKELNEDQKSVAFDMAENIISKNNKKDWSFVLKKAIADPDSIFTNFDETPVLKEVESIAEKYEIDDFQASILYHSKCQEKE